MKDKLSVKPRHAVLTILPRELAMRDSQQGRCYAAERSVYDVIDRGFSSPLSWDATRAYVDRVMRSKWMKKHHETAAMQWRLDRIKLDKGRANCAAKGGRHRLSLPEWGRKPAVILQKVAHCIADYKYRNVKHDWRWAQLFLQLVRHFVGVEAYNALRKAMRAKRVKYNPPRRISEATRQAAGARLRAWRAQQVAAQAAQIDWAHSA